MTIYINKDGQRLGPYTLAETQRLIAAGSIRPTDFAWHEGLPDWIQLNQMAGFADAALGAASIAEVPLQRAKRPIFVWIICLFFFICTPIILLSLVMTVLMALGAVPIPDSQREVVESQSTFDLVTTVLNDIMVPIWAVLFFLLKRSSLYIYAGMMALSVIAISYLLFAENMFSKLGEIGLIFIGLVMALNLALGYYNWHLFRKGVLR